MANWQSMPAIGQSVWCLSHGNGTITNVDKGADMVWAKYTKGPLAHDLDEFFGCFDEKLNQWVLIPL
jgi:hypothetical protein